MDTLIKLIIIYLACINLITFAVCGIDKRHAIKNKWRIPEATLLILSLIGGSIGMLFGMYLFNHKVKKPKFFICVPLICVLQIVCAALIYWGGMK